MHNNVIESIGKWGVKTTPYGVRISLVRGGDIIEVPEALQHYPSVSKYSRIANITDGIAHVCEAMGSAHLLEDGSCDISGGPWWSIPVKLLKPKYELYEATYWNWGNNHAGASQGVYYHIHRPVHILTVHPENVKYRYGTDESHARKGKFLHEEYLANWNLFSRSSECMDGEYLWVFLAKASHECA